MKTFVDGSKMIADDPPENNDLLDLDSLFKNHPEKRSLI
jgi:hypothetical protein